MAACKCGNDPDHGSGFQIMREPNTANINRIPTKVFADSRDPLFCIRIVAAKEHIRWTVRKLRFVEVCVPYGIERLDDIRVRQRPLDELATRVAKPSNQPGWNATRQVERVCCIDYNLALEILGTG